MAPASTVVPLWQSDTIRLLPSGGRYVLKFFDASGKATTKWLTKTSSVDEVLAKVNISHEEAQAIVDAVAAACASPSPKALSNLYWLVHDVEVKPGSSVEHRRIMVKSPRRY